MSNQPSPVIDDGDSDLSAKINDTLELLSNQHRRYALYTIIDTSNGVITLEDLIDEVVTLDAAVSQTGLTYRHYVDVATDLYHWHLPILSEIAIIEFDDISQTIKYYQQPFLETWIKRVREDEIGRTSQTEWFTTLHC